MNDLIGSTDMQQGQLTTFISDRFGCPNSALNLNGGYTYIQSGIYFDTPQFTISVWIYPQSVGLWSRVIDFSNGLHLDSIVLAQDSGLNLLPAVNIYSGSTNIEHVTSSTPLVLNQWQLLTATFDGSLLTIYINGIIKNSFSSVNTLQIVTRYNNTIGKSIDPNNGYSFSYLDDLRFYNKSLTQSEIIQLMNSNSKQFIDSTRIFKILLSLFS